jgi:hypothetical protein
MQFDALTDSSLPGSYEERSAHAVVSTELTPDIDDPPF